jgi:cytochrome c biogenesis factor
MTITCPVNDTIGICTTMDSAGAGLGVFLQYMGVALPPLLIILGIVAVIVAVGMGVAHLITKGMTSTRVK